MKKILAMSSMVCMLGIGSFSEATEPFVLMTIPKSGSHLVIKALHALTGGVPVWHTSFPSIRYINPEDGFLYTHLCVSSALEKNYRALSRLKKIVNIRDLRDVCISMIRQIEKNAWPGMSRETREMFKELSFEDRLSFVMEFTYDVSEVACFAPNSLQVSLQKIAEQAVRYLADPDVLVCRYEDLVGVQGGGTEEKQKEVLNKIAEHLGIFVDQDGIDVLARSLYGDESDPFGTGKLQNFRSTFHQGRIGGWRERFTEKHKAIFKEKFGDYLIALGYESDNNW